MLHTILHMCNLLLDIRVPPFQMITFLMREAADDLLEVCGAIYAGLSLIDTL